MKTTSKAYVYRVISLLNFILGDKKKPLRKTPKVKKKKKTKSLKVFF